MREGLVIDLFAGGGGMSLGIEAALCPLGRHVDIAINHDRVALAVHKANHPKTIHLTTDIFKVKPRDVTQGRHVAYLHGSPDCKEHSRAKGGKPIDKKIRCLPWSIYRWVHDVRPDVITVENVPEFRDWGPLGEDKKPIKEKKGQSFRRWVRQLEKLGYQIEHHILNASHYGAPTSRKRFFLIARCDGLPIRWPLPTHGGLGLKPLRSAAECLDFNLLCPSIFGRKLKDGRAKDLKPATLKRIAEGIRRFVIGNPKPFIVKVNHQGERRPEDIGDPLTTITAQSRCHALVAPTLIQTSYGEREGQQPRVLNIHEPVGTIVAQGVKHSLVATFLAKHFKGVTGVPLDGRPLDTITTADHHALTVACLATFRGTAENQTKAASVTEPLGTISAGGIHAAEVRTFLTAYYSQNGKADRGQSISEPLRTIPTVDRFGLVTVEGTQYEIVDIGMRMLEPDELLKAQFGRFAASYDLSAAKTKKDKVRLIGNSVCPELGQAIVAANFQREELREAAE